MTFDPEYFDMIVRDLKTAFVDDDSRRKALVDSVIEKMREHMPAHAPIESDYSYLETRGGRRPLNPSMYSRHDKDWQRRVAEMRAKNPGGYEKFDSPYLTNPPVVDIILGPDAAQLAGDVSGMAPFIFHFAGSGHPASITFDADDVDKVTAALNDLWNKGKYKVDIIELTHRIQSFVKAAKPVDADGFEQGQRKPPYPGWEPSETTRRPIRGEWDSPYRTNPPKLDDWEREVMKALDKREDLSREHYAWIADQIVKMRTGEKVDANHGVFPGAHAHNIPILHEDKDATLLRYINIHVELANDPDAVAQRLAEPTIVLLKEMIYENDGHISVEGIDWMDMLRMVAEYNSYDKIKWPETNDRADGVDHTHIESDYSYLETRGGRRPLNPSMYSRHDKDWQRRVAEMRAKNQNPPRTTYAELDAFLYNSKGMRTNKKKISNNTYIERVGDDIGVRFHDTLVAVCDRDGNITVNSGGHRTRTTKDRINQHTAPWEVIQRDGVWLWTTPGLSVDIPFTDGDVIAFDGTLQRADDLPKKSEPEAVSPPITIKLGRDEEWVVAHTSSDLIDFSDRNMDYDLWPTVTFKAADAQAVIDAISAEAENQDMLPKIADLNERIYKTAAKALRAKKTAPPADVLIVIPLNEDERNIATKAVPGSVAQGGTAYLQFYPFRATGIIKNIAALTMGDVSGQLISKIIKKAGVVAIGISADKNVMVDIAKTASIERDWGVFHTSVDGNSTYVLYFMPQQSEALVERIKELSDSDDDYRKAAKELIAVIAESMRSDEDFEEFEDETIETTPSLSTSLTPEQRRRYDELSDFEREALLGTYNRTRNPPYENERKEVQEARKASLKAGASLDVVRYIMDSVKGDGPRVALLNAAAKDSDITLSQIQEMDISEIPELDEVVHEFHDGWTIKLITTESGLDAENEEMNRGLDYECIADKSCRVYSLRDDKNKSHATIVVTRAGRYTRIFLNEDGEEWDVEINGKDDKKPDRESRELIGEWLRDIGAYEKMEPQSITHLMYERYGGSEENFTNYAIGDYYNYVSGYTESIEGGGGDYDLGLVEPIEFDDPDEVLKTTLDIWMRNLESTGYRRQGMDKVDEKIVEETADNLISFANDGRKYEYKAPKNETPDQKIEREKLIADTAKKDLKDLIDTAWDKFLNSPMAKDYENQTGDTPEDTLPEFMKWVHENFDPHSDQPTALPMLILENTGELDHRLGYVKDAPGQMTWDAYESETNPPYEEMRGEFISAGVPAEVIQYLDEQEDPAQRGRLLNAVKKKKAAITVAELEAIAPPKKRGPTVDETLVAERTFPGYRPENGKNEGIEAFQRWIQVQMVKHRDGVYKTNTTSGDHSDPTLRMYRYKWPEDFSVCVACTDIIGNTKRSQIMRAFHDIYDWAEANGVEIASYTLAKAAEESELWHQECSTGAGGKYEADGEETVYAYADGWTIRKVTSERNLEIEGALMQHCVGGYYNRVSRGHSIIYSLRDKKNKPHATMEVLGEERSNSGINTYFEQIQGKQNDEPIAEYKERIKEWVETLPNPEWASAEEPSAYDQDADDYVNALVEWYLDKDSRDDYGILRNGGEITQFRLGQFMDSIERRRQPVFPWGTDTELAKLSFLSDVENFAEPVKGKPFSVLDISNIGGYRSNLHYIYKKMDDVVEHFDNSNFFEDSGFEFEEEEPAEPDQNDYDNDEDYNADYLAWETDHANWEKMKEEWREKAEMEWRDNSLMEWDEYKFYRGLLKEYMKIAHAAGMTMWEGWDKN